ncbi:hypothetical protein HQ585_09065 [candidate division KSB1 bacterium]|nr:hypothetical protein [candidate division KSB1 bacterium]
MEQNDLKDANTPSQSSHVEIPKLFYSDATGMPFHRCVDCGISLLESGTHYFIEKAIKNYPKLGTTDTIIEYAICYECYMEVQKSLSKQSLQSIETYFLENVNLYTRMKEVLEPVDSDPERWLSKCIVKGIDRKTAPEYQIMCECTGNQMHLSLAPYMVSMEALNEITDLLSAQTLDALNDFHKEHLGMPPELEPILKDQPYFMF